MQNSLPFFRSIKTPLEVITPIATGMTFPESADLALELYSADIDLFVGIVAQSDSSAAVLKHIRTPGHYDSDTRMSLLKLFRRCVSLVCDTENTKKITKISTDTIVENYGNTFKPIAALKQQFSSLSIAQRYAIAALLSENDGRGQSGYVLTGHFFDWFETTFGGLFSIRGPRGAGKDIELSTVYPLFKGSYPCDFVVTDLQSDKVVAVGFARYDSTRGGSQSDDRTGGNSNKVEKAKAFFSKTGEKFKIVFLADGPGLGHKDTWEEACTLDGEWDDNVRVTTLKLASTRITADWLSS